MAKRKGTVGGATRKAARRKPDAPRTPAQQAAIERAAVAFFASKGSPVPGVSPEQHGRNVVARMQGKPAPKLPAQQRSNKKVTALGEAKNAARLGRSNGGGGTVRAHTRNGKRVKAHRRS